MYVGLCWRHIGVRWWEHMSLSWRTGRQEIGIQTDVKDHVRECKTPIDSDNFRIVAREENNFLLRVKESLLIKHHDPMLNKDKYSTPLMLF